MIESYVSLHKLAVDEIELLIPFVFSSYIKLIFTIRLHFVTILMILIIAVKS